MPPKEGYVLAGACLFVKTTDPTFMKIIPDIHRVRKNGTASILSIILTMFNKFSQFLVHLILTFKVTEKLLKKVPSLLAQHKVMMT